MLGRALLIAVVLAGCGDDGGDDDDDADGGVPYVPELFLPTPETRAYCGAGGGDDEAIEARITEALGELSVLEKVDLVHGASFAPTDGVWLVPGNERLDLPGLRMLDGPRGLSQVSDLNGTAFPVAMMRGATWDPALEQRVGAAMARELRTAGGDVLLAPTMNILRHPRWGRAQETYSEDTHHMAEMAIGFVRGVQGEGVLASAKHYAANSIEDTRYDVDVQLDERTLREIYLPHFRRVVQDAQVATVMSAYNSVNGFTCDQQQHLLTDVLKQSWGFAGLVMSDWILGTHGDVDSLLAGLDVEMPSGQHFVDLADAVDDGELDQHRLDDAVRRVLRAQLCFGLDEVTPVRDEDPSVRETAEHLALAREVAVRGAVLLKNDGVLPLGAGVTSIVVAGRNAAEPNIGDRGSSAVTPTAVVTAIDGLVARAGDGVTVTAVASADDPAVAEADVVIVVTGLQDVDEGEATIGGGDRASMAIPDEEIALIEALAAVHPAVVVVLEGGSAFVTAGWDGDVEALMLGFYPGSQGGHALAALLFGDAAPSGRLPFSMPEAEGDLPGFDNESLVVTYDYFHGYRHLAREGTAARYPFGFGLSYTTFAHDALSVERDGDTIVASVEVTNTGEVAAIETVQLYVTAIDSSYDRAPRDLRAFSQVALEVGASDTVELRVPVSELAVWDVAADDWTLEPLTYEITIAHDAEDVGLSASVELD